MIFDVYYDLVHGDGITVRRRSERIGRPRCALGATEVPKAVDEG